jgi:hypothetical protein
MCVLGDGRRIHAGTDRRADRHRLAHAEEDVDGRLGRMGGALQLVEDLVALRRGRRRDLTVHHLVDVGFAELRQRHVGAHHALPDIAGQEGIGLVQRGGVEMVGQRLQRRGLEYVDAKAALGGRNDGGELGIRQLGGTVGGEELADVFRHGAQRGPYLFPDGRLLVDLRSGIDVDRGFGCVEIRRQTHQEQKSKHALTPR